MFGNVSPELSQWDRPYIRDVNKSLVYCTAALTHGPVHGLSFATLRGAVTLHAIYGHSYKGTDA